MEFKTILFATDFSEGSDFAFQAALSMARKYGSKLVVVHIINEPVDLRGFYVPHISFDKL
jgi:nucleotide-binding universal stress UspA family protein